MEVLGCSPVEGESINEATPAELARVAPPAPPNDSDSVLSLHLVPLL